MKILHIIPSYLPAKLASGPIIPTHNLNKELVKKGIEVVVYTTNLDGTKILDVPLNQEIDIDGVKVFYFPISFRSWQYSFALHRALAKNVKNFDLIHITSVFLSVSTLGAYYAKKFKKPYIISPHGSLMSDPLSRHSLKKKVYLNLIEKKNLKEAVVHFLVDQEKDDYLKTNLPLKEAVVIPNGIDNKENIKKTTFFNFNMSINGNVDIKNLDFQKTNFRTKFGIGSDKKLVLFLARLHPIKGLDTLIPAFSEVIKKNSRVVLILAGPDEINYKKEVELKIENYQLKISKDVVFTGMLTGEDKISALQESDIFVLPSYSECLPMAVIEAMYFGLPVIVTRNVGIASFIEKAGAGIVVEKNEKQLAEAILKILNNSDLGKEMGRRGRNLVEIEFFSLKVAERWIEEYNKIIKIFKKYE